MKRDLGTIFTLSTTSILTSYVASGVQNGGRPDSYRLLMLLTTVASTNITSYTVKCTASSDGVTYSDVTTQTDDLTPDTEHTFAVGAAGTPQMDSLILPGGFPYWKIQVKAVGGVGKAGESFVVRAEAV
jgi:hypothetical protein